MGVPDQVPHDVQILEKAPCVACVPGPVCGTSLAAYGAALTQQHQGLDMVQAGWCLDEGLVLEVHK